ncbi:MAG: 3-oxoacyl-[acyl-carrier protein] reductase [Actinomycetota bacterium]|nr:3-oxoacyl-[acyl-carrier protein] reductase [Actinomycetota bacterium]
MPAPDGTTRLEGTTSLVTGASRGIGHAIARRLAAEGSLVVVHYGSNEAAARRTVGLITESGGSAVAVGVPFGRPDDGDRLWDAVTDTLARRGARPGVDILVNNAAIGSSSPIAATTVEEFDRVFAVNVRSPFLIVQRGLHHVRDGGRIVNISSGVTRIALPEVIAYSMTKGALNTFTLTLAHELGARGITVNAVAPGVVVTETNAVWMADPAARTRAAGYSVFERVGEPEDIAGVVAFLASPQAHWITGQVIDATGGSLLGSRPLRTGSLEPQPS